MILDKNSNFGRYTFKGREVVEKFLREHPLSTLTENRYELEDGIFVMFQTYAPHENHSFEAHRKYADVQVILDGGEKIFWAELEDGVCTKAYDEAADVAFFQVDDHRATEVHLLKEMFVVLFPQDLHAPLNSLCTDSVKKLVFKIPID